MSPLFVFAYHIAAVICILYTLFSLFKFVKLKHSWSNKDLKHQEKLEKVLHSLDGNLTHKYSKDVNFYTGHRFYITEKSQNLIIEGFKKLEYLEILLNNSPFKESKSDFVVLLRQQIERFKEIYRAANHGDDYSYSKFEGKSYAIYHIPNFLLNSAISWMIKQNNEDSISKQDLKTSFMIKTLEENYNKLGDYLEGTLTKEQEALIDDQRTELLKTIEDIKFNDKSLRLTNELKANKIYIKNFKDSFK